MTHSKPSIAPAVALLVLIAAINFPRMLHDAGPNPAGVVFGTSPLVPFTSVRRSAKQVNWPFFAGAHTGLTLVVGFAFAFAPTVTAASAGSAADSELIASAATVRELMESSLRDLDWRGGVRSPSIRTVVLQALLWSARLDHRLWSCLDS